MVDRATTQPDQRILKLSCHRTGVVDVLVVAMKKALEELWWLIHSCSPRLQGEEHIVLQQKFKGEVLEQRYCLGRCDIREVVDRSEALQDLGVLNTISTPCNLVRDAFYDTLIYCKTARIPFCD